MNMNEIIRLSRDCEATMIPAGNKIMIPKGTQARITQSLGGSYTVVTDHGYMVRIADRDADAIGKEVPKEAQASSDAIVEIPDFEKVKEMVWAQMKTCYDPEIPVNIVDLGLIYVCEVAPIPEGGYKVHVEMTLTAPGCGMGEVLKGDVARKIMNVPGVKAVNVQLVWEPQWDQSRMSDAAKLQLNML